jgi:hypothetical protein
MSDGNNDWRVIEGATDMQGAAASSDAIASTADAAATTTATTTTKKAAYRATEFKFNSSSGAETGSLEVVTELVMDKDGVMFLTLPKEMKVPDIKNLTITTITSSDAAARYILEGVTNVCDSDDLGDLLNTYITPCDTETKIKIIMEDTSAIKDFTVAHPVSFKLSGLYTPTATPVKFEIRTDKSLRVHATVDIPGVTTASTSAEIMVKDCKFKLTLTDDTPEAKDVTVKYEFSFTPPSAFKIKSGSKLYFLYSDDFTLPNPGDIKIAVNGYTVLDSDKGEYTLKSKEKCGTPSKDQQARLKEMGANFESEMKLCTKYYVLELRKDIAVNESGKLAVSLLGMTNPPFYPDRAPEGKRDYLVKPFNSAICIMVLDTNIGKVLVNPASESYSNIGAYFRGNYPVKNKKSANGRRGNDDDDAADIHGDDAAEKRSRQSRPAPSSRAANVYTVNYFYDGQGAGEYGYIARPDIFGTTPYSYDSGGRGGLGSSDKYLAKQYRDLEEKKRLQQEQQARGPGAVGQIVPPMGVAPSALNGGVQPYNSEIRF